MLHVHPYAACLKYQNQIDQSTMKKITRLLANYSHFSKKEIEITWNALLLSGTLFITFGTELQDKHWEAYEWQIMKSYSLYLWCPQVQFY